MGSRNDSHRRLSPSSLGYEKKNVKCPNMGVREVSTDGSPHFAVPIVWEFHINVVSTALLQQTSPRDCGKRLLYLEDTRKRFIVLAKLSWCGVA